MTRGRSNHGAILQQPVQIIRKGTCTRSLCECWYPPECRFYETESGCSVGDKWLFPHHKVDEQPHKEPKKSYRSTKEKRRQECCGCCEKPKLGCVSQDSESLESQRGAQSQGNPMRKVLGSIRRVRFTQFTLRQASIRYNKGPSLGKIRVKLLHQRSPHAMKFEGRSQEEIARQQRCAQSTAWSLPENIYKLKEKGQSYILLALGGVGIVGDINKGAGKKKVCSGFRS